MSELKLDSCLKNVLHVFMWKDNRFTLQQLQKSWGGQMPSRGPPCYGISKKCLQNLSSREKSLLLALDVFSVGWVKKRHLKTTRDPTYSS